MSGIRQEIEAAWRLLTARDRGGLEVREVESLVRPHETALLGVDGDGTRHVLVRVAPNTHIPYDARSHGVILQGRRLLDGGIERHYLDVSCSVPRLFRVFSLLISDMLTHLRESEDPAQQVCPKVLQQWRELLRNAGQPPDLPSTRGAYGELHQLRQLLAHGPVPITVWTGPYGQPKDFSAPGGELEVKSLGSQRLKSVQVNSLDQLEWPSDGRPLYLVVQSVLDNAGGETLSELVDDVERAGVSRQDVLDRLALIGLASPDEPPVSEMRFSIGNELAYRVDEHFPTLAPSKLRSALPSAIVNVRYQLELQGLDDWLLSESEVYQARGKFVSSCH